MADTPIYRDRTQPVEKRVNDVVGRMTIEEQVGQMVQADSREYGVELIQQQHVGSSLY
jgi:beta-glucosidase